MIPANQRDKCDPARARSCDSGSAGAWMLTLAFADGEAPARLKGREATPWCDDQGNLCARAFSEGALHRIEWPGLGVFLFSAGSREVRVWPEVKAKPEIVID